MDARGDEETPDPPTIPKNLEQRVWGTHHITAAEFLANRRIRSDGSTSTVRYVRGKDQINDIATFYTQHNLSGRSLPSAQHVIELARTIGDVNDFPRLDSILVGKLVDWLNSKENSKYLPQAGSVGEPVVAAELTRSARALISGKSDQQAERYMARRHSVDRTGLPLRAKEALQSPVAYPDIPSSAYERIRPTRAWVRLNSQEPLARAFARVGIDMGDATEVEHGWARRTIERQLERATDKVAHYKAQLQEMHKEYQNMVSKAESY